MLNWRGLGSLQHFWLTKLPLAAAMLFVQTGKVRICLCIVREMNDFYRLLLGSAFKQVCCKCALYNFSLYCLFLFKFLVDGPRHLVTKCVFSMKIKSTVLSFFNICPFSQQGCALSARRQKSVSSTSRI